MKIEVPSAFHFRGNKSFLLFLFSAAICLCACAEVNYQVVPLPQQISIDKSGKYMLLTKEMTVGYPANNAQMKRNAEFAAEYLGLSVTSDKKNADVNLMLGLKSMNPDAYAISVNKKGITIQGASESGVFYGIQTLRKSIMNETGEIRLPYAWVCGSPRFSYRGTELDCARHFFPVTFIKKFIDILALHGINRFHYWQRRQASAPAPSSARTSASPTLTMPSTTTPPRLATTPRKRCARLLPTQQSATLRLSRK